MANQFLPFATEVTANVMSQADYNTSDQRTDGQQPGLALSELNNKALRQSSTITSQFAQYMADRLGEDVLDNGQLEDIYDQIVALFESTTPAGTMLHYGGSVAPVGYLLCYGQSLLRADYPALFAAIGTAFGAADGTHFNLPDLRGRVLAGLDNMGGVAANRLTGAVLTPDGNTMGAVGGTQTHTLVTGEMPSHTHTQDAHTHTQNSHNHTQDAHTHTQNAHTHTQNAHAHRVYSGQNPIQSMGITVGAQPFTAAFGAGTSVDNAPPTADATATNQNTTATNQNTTATNQAATATNQNTTATNQNTGGDGAHLNTQPTMVVNVIIKT